ncbi:MAG: hypothetical protein AB8B57_03410 [Congregibacter sp.]
MSEQISNTQNEDSEKPGDITVPSIDTLIGERAGSKPEFLEQMAPDKLINCVMRLAMEVSVIRDRLDIYEAVVEEAIPGMQAKIENFASSEEIEGHRAQRRSALIKNLMRDLQ